MEHTPSMLSETHTQRILDLASQRVTLPPKNVLHS